MAVVKNLWLRGTTQKLGGTVLYQSKGRTLQRELAPQVSNPRTPAQMATRVRLANLVQLYKAGRGWMKASFESKKQTQSDYNAFVSANLAKANVYLTKQQVAAGAAVVAPVTITKGSLPPVNLTSQSSGLVSDINTGIIEDTPDMSVGEMSEAIIGANPGIQAGDQLSLIQFVQQTGADGTPYVVCRAYEVILDPNNNTLFEDFMPEYVAIEAVGGKYYLMVGPTAPMGGYAFVISRTVGSTIRVSSQELVLTADDTVYPLYTSQAAYNAAVQSYGEGEAIFLSSVDAYGIDGSQAVTRQLVEIQINGTSYNASSRLPDSIASGATVRFIFNENIPSGAATTAFFKLTSDGGINVAMTNVQNTGNNIVQATTTAAITKPQVNAVGVLFSVSLDDYTHRMEIAFGGNNSIE